MVNRITTIVFGMFALLSFSTYSMESKAEYEQRVFQEEESKRTAGELNKQETAYAMQTALNALFERARGNVAAQYRLLTIVEGANKNNVQLRRQRDALVILFFDPSVDKQGAFDLLQALVQKNDRHEGRKTLRWQARWQKEGKVNEKNVQVTEYQNMKALLEPWAKIIGSLPARVRNLTNKELEQSLPMLLQLLIDKTDLLTIPFLLEAHIAQLRKQPTTEEHREAREEFGGL